jgi:ribose/xylose/arabinose/galactoside ABC-type transport system permease subunit
VTLALDSVRIRGRDQLRVLNPRIIGLLLAIVAAAAVFQINNSNFLTVANMLTLLQSMSALVILSMGLTFVILTGEIDLSVGSIFGLTPMVTALLWVHGVAMLPSVLIGLALGCGIGLVNGFIVTRFDIPSFIVTLGTMNVVYGATLLISGASSVDPNYPASGKPVPQGQYQLFRDFASSQVIPKLPSQIWWFLGTAIVLWILRHRTIFGFRLIAIGGSVESARTARIRVSRYLMIVFVLAGLFAALAGMLEFSFLGSTDPNAGQNLLFPAFAAVIVGGTSLNGGVGTIGGTVIGAVLLSILDNGLSLIGVGSYTQLIFVGGITVAAVTLDRWTTSRHQPGVYRV